MLKGPQYISYAQVFGWRDTNSVPEIPDTQSVSSQSVDLSPMTGSLCRGGNRYVDGDLLTFGYLVLDDSLGVHYYRLFNVKSFPWIPLLSAI